jgi:hypothetical protein
LYGKIAAAAAAPKSFNPRIAVNRIQTKSYTAIIAQQR